MPIFLTNSNVFDYTGTVEEATVGIKRTVMLVLGTL